MKHCQKLDTVRAEQLSNKNDIVIEKAFSTGLKTF